VDKNGSIGESDIPVILPVAYKLLPHHFSLVRWALISTPKSKLRILVFPQKILAIAATLKTFMSIEMNKNKLFNRFGYNQLFFPYQNSGYNNFIDSRYHH
jgi:hypothetical protein